MTDLNKEAELKKSLLQKYPILKYFEYAHLPEKLKERSKLFETLAWEIAMESPVGPEVSAALRKLLETKDCAVRAILP